MTGQRFGRYTVLKKMPWDGKTHGALWLCKCDCGNERVVISSNLIRGNSTSCGCYSNEIANLKHLVHGLRKHPLYMTWADMKSRCYNEGTPAYKWYGARGITICDEWKDDFLSFYEHVTKLPFYGEPGRSLDRIDNDGNYEPGNVRWATAQEQVNNRRCSSGRC